jgi:hypothetical protein
MLLWAFIAAIIVVLACCDTSKFLRDDHPGVQPDWNWAVTAWPGSERQTPLRIPGPHWLRSPEALPGLPIPLEAGMSIGMMLISVDC